MTIDAPPSPAHHDESGAGPAEAGQLGRMPSRMAGWSVTPVGAGLWLSAAGREAPAEVQALAAEPGRVSLVVDAAGPDPRTDNLLALLVPALSPSAPSLRLVLPAAADRYASMAHSFGVDLIAAEAQVAIMPGGRAVVRPAGPDARGGLPQWRRFLPSGDQQAAGSLAPSAAWERGLDEAWAAAAAQGTTGRRVPAGLALALGQASAATGPALADAVWPDVDRVTIVVGDDAPAAEVLAALGRLLPLLPLSATDGVRLYWPRAAAGQAGGRLQELAAEVGADLIAPAGDVAVSGFGAVAYSQAGAAPWLRYSSQGEVEVLGSLYPEPAWERGLATADLENLPGDVSIEHTASGLCISRPGQPDGGLAATARSIVPDPFAVTIVAGGDAGDRQVRQAVESVIDRLPPAATQAVRLLLNGAAAGGPQSFAQFLADSVGAAVTAPAERWTSTPDGRVRPLSPGEITTAGGQPWPQFRPRPPAARAPELPGPGPGKRISAAPVPPSPPADPPAPPPGHDVADLAGPAQPPARAASDEQPRPDYASQEPGPDIPPVTSAGPDLPEQPVTGQPPAAAGGPQPPAAAGGPQPPAGPARTVVPILRGHRSSPDERLRYRESAGRYQSCLVSVRRVLSQRPGLRAAAAVEGEETVTTDFAAVLDLLSDDQRHIAAALRSDPGPADPRAACVVSGLRRLPSFSGAVFASAMPSAEGTADYAAGATLIEPAFVYSTSARQVALDGTISYVIWSETGKRISALAANLSPDEIMFAAGTVFKVLRTDAASGSGQARIFLRESSRPGAEPAGAALDEADHRILDRLAEAAALRDGVAARDARPAGLAGRVLQPIGLDDRGIPFQVAADAG
jgi:hypothetical protein